MEWSANCDQSVVERGSDGEGGPLAPHVGRMRANRKSAKMRINLSAARPALARLDRNGLDLTNVGSLRQNLGSARQSVARIVEVLLSARPNFTSAKFGRIWSELGDVRPDLANTSPNSVELARPPCGNYSSPPP